jgi:hypothetical protein
VKELAEKGHAISGEKLWKELEEQHVVDRTWQSMKERFKKFILPRSADVTLKQLVAGVGTSPAVVVAKAPTEAEVVEEIDDDDNDGDHCRRSSGVAGAVGVVAVAAEQKRDAVVDDAPNKETSKSTPTSESRASGAWHPRMKRMRSDDVDNGQRDRNGGDADEQVVKRVVVENTSKDATTASTTDAVVELSRAQFDQLWNEVADTSDEAHSIARSAVDVMSRLHNVPRMVAAHALICCTGDVLLANELLRIGPDAMRARRHPMYFDYADDCAVASKSLHDRPPAYIQLRRRFCQLPD